MMKKSSDNLASYDLCSKCARCCRCVISSYSEDELKNLEDSEAKLFISFFKKYESLADVPKELKEHIEEISQLQNKVPEVWYCKYLDEDNHCLIYEDRPDFCRTYPKNGWIVTPPGCGYRGWQFVQREKQKRIIRKLKEQLLVLKINDTKNSDDDMILKDLEKQIIEKINKYQKYGADSW